MADPKLSTIQTSDLQALVNLIQTNLRTQPLSIGDNASPFVMLPEGYALRDITSFLGAPPTAHGSTAFSDLQSLIGYVNEEKDLSTRAYYVAKPAPALVVVLNDTRRLVAPVETSVFVPPAIEGDRAKSWRDLRASFAYPLSEEWVRWTANSGKKFAQAEFAAFIESNLPDIVSPTGDVMLTVAKTLEAKNNVNFSSAISLENNSREFTYEEVIQGSAAKGTMEIPAQFRLGIPVFENGSYYQVTAFLRYELRAGSLSLKYELDRAHKILDVALSESIELFRGATGVPVYRGTPASSSRER